MDIQEIVKRINDNSQLLSAGNIPEIDRDILLEDLRSLYLLAKSGTVSQRVMKEDIKPFVADIMPAIVQEELEDIFVPVIKAQPVAESKPIVETPAVTEQKAPIVEEKAAPVQQVVEKQEPVQPPVQSTPEIKEEPVYVPKEETRPKTATSINDVFAGEERSLNERLSGGDKRPALNDQAGRKDLKSMIDFNKQYVLTNELFKGDSQAFQSAITHINSAPNIEAAFEYIKTELLPKYKWSGEMQSARLFDKLVRQKFGL